MLTVETAVFDCNYWFSSSRGRKGQSYPVEYFLGSVKEYSEGKIHMSEPESGKGNVNTVYFVNQAGGNTRISGTAEFVYDEWARDCKCLLRFELPVRKKIYFYKLAFALKCYKLMWEYLARNLKADVNILVLLNLGVYGNWRRHSTYFVPGPLQSEWHGLCHWNIFL